MRTWHIINNVKLADHTVKCKETKRTKMKKKKTTKICGIFSTLYVIAEHEYIELCASFQCLHVMRMLFISQYETEQRAIANDPCCHASQQTKHDHILTIYIYK